MKEMLMLTNEGNVMDVRKDFEATVKKVNKVVKALEPSAARFHAFILANGYVPSENMNVRDYSGYAPDFDEYVLEFVTSSEEKEVAGYCYSFTLGLNDGAEHMVFVMPFEYVEDPDAWEAAVLTKQNADKAIAQKALYAQFPKWAESLPEDALKVLPIADYYKKNFATEGEYIHAEWTTAPYSRRDYMVRVSDGAVFFAGPNYLGWIVEGKIPQVGK